LHVELSACAIELCKPLALGGISHYHEAPGLRVGAGRRLQRDLDAFFDDFLRHRALEIEPQADAPRRFENPVDTRQVDATRC
jgi:hypothetical protein